MEVSYNIDRRKKIIKKAGLIFIIIVILLTFFSKTINSFLLPVVETAEPRRGVLEKTVEAGGEVKLLSVEKLKSNGEWKITDVRVKQGGFVKKGDVLATVDESDIALALKKKELELIALKVEINKLANASDNGGGLFALEEDVKAAQKDVGIQQENVDTLENLYQAGAVPLKDLKDAKNRLDASKNNLEVKTGNLERQKPDFADSLRQKQLEYEIKQLEYEDLKRNSPVDGKLKSDTDGIVKSVLIEKDSLSSTGQTLFEIGRTEGGYTVQWRLDGKKAAMVPIGDIVRISFEGPANIEQDAVVSSRQYIGGEGVYLYTASITVRLDKDSKVKLEDGQQANVRYSQRSFSYKLVLPRSSVNTSDNRRGFVYILKQRESALGIEDYVEKVDVTISDYDDFNYAVDGALDENSKIVVFSSKGLQDGMQVRME